MATRGSTKRHLLLIQQIQDKKYPTKKELNDFLNTQGFEISSRTLDRDFQIVRDEYEIEIEYDNEKRGYKLVNTENKDFRFLIDILELRDKVEQLSSNYQQAIQNKRYIAFERNGNFKGMNLIPTIVESIKNGHKIRFNYQSFSKSTPSIFSIEPLLVVENRNRWYVMGYHKESDMVRTFGLDRIEQLESLPEKIKNPFPFDYDKYFQNTFGITYLENEPEVIELSFDSSFGNYIKNLPIHSSQTVLVDNEEELRIRLQLIINVDFLNLIYSYTGRVRIISPTHLKETVLNEYQRAIDKNI